MKYFEHFKELCEALEGPGAFLVVESGGRVNAMTIGWAQAGVIWGQPVMTVLVRPSRYTHAMLGKAKGFSVCVPRRGEMKKELAFCGTKSGRDYDKIRACGLKLKAGEPGVKYIDGCELVYQCVLCGRTELKAGTVDAAAMGKYYPEGDLHTVYFGRIIKGERFE